MMDIFAVALDDSDRKGAEVDAVANLAPSQDMAPSQEELGTTWIDERMEISDDTGSAALSTEVAIAHGSPAPEKATRTKRASSSRHQDVGAKRKCNPENRFSLQCLDIVDGSHVPCLIVKRGRYQAPVPLWCQYRAAWRHADFEGTKWLIVSNLESWVKGLVNAVTNKSVRDVAKTFADHFRKHFQTCLATARRARNLDDPFSESDSEDNRGAVGWRATGVRPPP